MTTTTARHSLWRSRRFFSAPPRASTSTSASITCITITKDDTDDDVLLVEGYHERQQLHCHHHHYHSRRRQRRRPPKLLSRTCSLLILLLCLSLRQQAMIQACPVTLDIWIFGTFEECLTPGTAPNAKGRLTADDACRETEVVETVNASFVSQLPGTYSATCRPSVTQEELDEFPLGQLEIWESGCTDDACDRSPSSIEPPDVCDRDRTTVASLYSRVNPPGVFAVQDAWKMTTGRFDCWYIGGGPDGSLSVVLAIFGNCNEDCSGTTTTTTAAPVMAEPTASPTALPTAESTGVPPTATPLSATTVPQPTAWPTAFPTFAPTTLQPIITTTTTAAPTTTPSSEPTATPTFSPLATTTTTTTPPPTVEEEAEEVVDTPTATPSGPIATAAPNDKNDNAPTMAPALDDDDDDNDDDNGNNSTNPEGVVSTNPIGSGGSNRKKATMTAVVAGAITGVLVVSIGAFIYVLYSKRTRHAETSSKLDNAAASAGGSTSGAVGDILPVSTTMPLSPPISPASADESTEPPPLSYSYPRHYHAQVVLHNHHQRTGHMTGTDVEISGPTDDVSTLGEPLGTGGGDAATRTDESTASIQLSYVQHEIASHASQTPFLNTAARVGGATAAGSAAEVSTHTLNIDNDDDASFEACLLPDGPRTPPRGDAANKKTRKIGTTFQIQVPANRRLGLLLDGSTVRAVSPDSIFALRVRAGDVLVHIDDTYVEHYSQTAIAALCQQQQDKNNAQKKNGLRNFVFARGGGHGRSDGNPRQNRHVPMDAVMENPSSGSAAGVGGASRDVVVDPAGSPGRVV